MPAAAPPPPTNGPDPEPGTPEPCRQRRAAERLAIATALHEDTAQVLGFVPVQLAALQEGRPESEARQEMDELRQVVRVELGRVLELVRVLRDPDAPVS